MYCVQSKKIIEGTIINNVNTGTWSEVDISRLVPAILVYQNNSITSVNANGYMLQAGDENPGFRNNNLDNESIIGNEFTWNGKDSSSLTHGIFTGYNLNAIIKYNYLKNVPMSIVRKSNGMTNTAGSVAYNIVVNPKVAVVVKGMNNVNIFNNTFYTTMTPSQTWRGLVDVIPILMMGLQEPSQGTKYLIIYFMQSMRP